MFSLTYESAADRNELRFGGRSGLKYTYYPPPSPPTLLHICCCACMVRLSNQAYILIFLFYQNYGRSIYIKTSGNKWKINKTELARG